MSFQFCQKFSTNSKRILTVPQLRISLNNLAAKRGFKSNIQYAPHAFSFEEAARRFSAAESERLFAPIKFAAGADALVPSEACPLKKALVPCFRVQAFIKKTDYSGKYGIPHKDSDGKTNYFCRDYYPISGTLGSIKYTASHDRNMTIYAGFDWNAKSVESALECYTIRNFKDFDPSQIPLDISIAPFLLRSAIAQEKANKRIVSAEEDRAREDIHRRTGYPADSKVRLNIDYQDFELIPWVLPAYVLQYPGYPAQVLSAISVNDKNILGPKRYSFTKTAAVTAVASSFMALFFPHIALATRFAAIGTSSTLAGLLARYQGSNFNFDNEIRKIEGEKENNETVSETIADKERFNATARDFNLEKNTQSSQFEDSFYETLGLDPKKPITKEDVEAAFNNKIKEAHPDQGGSSKRTQDLFKARSILFSSAGGLSRKNIKTNPKIHDTGRRQFSTEAKPTIQVKWAFQDNAKPGPSLREVDDKNSAQSYQLVKVGKVDSHELDKGEDTMRMGYDKKSTMQRKNPPRSVYDPNAYQLIQTVIVDKNYEKAYEMVKTGKVHPDGHDKGENTLLTECVKNGTLQDMAFAMDKLGASVDTSCDCPWNNTPLIYAAIKGDVKKAEILLKRNATVNLINKQGKTALDIAFEKNDDAMKALLKEYGGKQHLTLPGNEGFWTRVKAKVIGYHDVSDRTLLSRNESTEEASSSSTATKPRKP